MDYDDLGRPITISKQLNNDVATIKLSFKTNMMPRAVKEQKTCTGLQQ